MSASSRVMACGHPESMMVYRDGNSVERDASGRAVKLWCARPAAVCLWCEINRLWEQHLALRLFAGIVSIEVHDLMGLAVAHGFPGWKDHAQYGPALQERGGFTQADLMAEARAFLEGQAE